MIEALDHANIRTARLDEMVAWYERVLGLRTGPRPPFGFPGAWLYAGEHALVHLVEVDAPVPEAAGLALEHVAFRATGYDRFINMLEAEGLPFRLARVPEFPIVQVNIADPDGNHLHVDFSTEDAAASGL